jgi:electron transport complex protein RnfD
MNAPEADNHDIKKLLTVSPSPHIRNSENTRTIMTDVVIALLPALIWGVYIFGLRTLTITVISVVSCVLFEFLFRLALKRPQTVTDFSAVVTGVLLALNLPATVSLWIPVVGAFFAIVIVKQLFGGIGMNIVNPALAARVFLFSWANEMTTYPKPMVNLSPLELTLKNVDSVASATPLISLRDGVVPADLSLFDLLIGNNAGVIGEISVLLLIAGGVYLLCRRVITWHIPAAFLGVFTIATFFINGQDLTIYQLLSGGLFLGAIFMATDYATSPVTTVGKLIFGAGCALLTVLIRTFGGYNEGVSFAILIMNCFVWYLDKYSRPKIFGFTKKKKEVV